MSVDEVFIDKMAFHQMTIGKITLMYLSRWKAFDELAFDGLVFD